MKLSAHIIAFTMVVGTAEAQSKVEELCGRNHINQATVYGDVTPNPDGYYIRSLQTQLSYGDFRIVKAVGRTFHLCTRDAATPGMDTSTAINLANKRVIKYLFIPVCEQAKWSGS